MLIVDSNKAFRSAGDGSGRLPSPGTLARKVKNRTNASEADREVRDFRCTLTS